MKRFRFMDTCSGDHLGEYSASCIEDAVQQMAEYWGYSSHEEMSQALGGTCYADTRAWCDDVPVPMVRAALSKAGHTV